MPFEPIVPEGQHLGKSRNVDDAVVGHLFDDDTNELKGHAAWTWVDDPEDEYSTDIRDDYEPPRPLTPEEIEQIAQLTILIITGIVKGVQAASPHVKRLWVGRIVPTAKSAWKRVSSIGKKTIDSAPQEPTSSVSRARFVASSAGIELSLAESKLTMSRLEWEQRFRAMLAAGAFEAEQRRILAIATIDDDAQVLEADEAADQLSPQQFADRITTMLAANPSLLNTATISELERVFAARTNPSDESGPAKLSPM